MALRRGGEILLGLKKYKFGKGFYNGIGGKAEPGETILETAIRECEEEVGVKVTKCEKMATIYFPKLFYRGEYVNSTMHCFVASEWEGEPVETEEMAPKWFKIAELPYEQMLPDDRHWLPKVLAGQKIEGVFSFNKDLKLLDYSVYEMPEDIIAELYDSDFGLVDGYAPSYKARSAARAVLLDDKGQVGLLDATNRHIYKLPGGGIEEGESVEEALRREVIEESGYTITRAKSLGQTIEYRHKFNQVNLTFTFIAHTDKFVGQNLAEDEAEDGFELKWFKNIDAAIQAVESVKVDKSDYAAMFFTKRELAILRAAKEKL